MEGINQAPKPVHEFKVRAGETIAANLIQVADLLKNGEAVVYPGKLNETGQIDAMMTSDPEEKIRFNSFEELKPVIRATVKSYMQDYLASLDNGEFEMFKYGPIFLREAELLAQLIDLLSEKSHT